MMMQQGSLPPDGKAGFHARSMRSGKGHSSRRMPSLTEDRLERVQVVREISARSRGWHGRLGDCTSATSRTVLAVAESADPALPIGFPTMTSISCREVDAQDGPLPRIAVVRGAGLLQSSSRPATVHRACSPSNHIRRPIAQPTSYDQVLEEGDAHRRSSRSPKGPPC